jgi:transcriptional regulator with PAS, ATPase and Fis domain
LRGGPKPPLTLSERSESKGQTAPAPHRKRPQDLEARDLENALRQARGNKTRAARLLGIAVNTLKAQLKKLGR